METVDSTQVMPSTERNDLRPSPRRKKNVPFTKNTPLPSAFVPVPMQGENDTPSVECSHRPLVVNTKRPAPNATPSQIDPSVLRILLQVLPPSCEAVLAPRPGFSHVLPGNARHKP